MTSYNIFNKAQLEQELKNAGDKLVILDFYADRRGTCKISPQLEKLCQLYGKKIKVLKINVVFCEKIAFSYNITRTPTFVFIKAKKILNVMVGENAENLAKNIEKYVEGGKKSLATKYVLDTDNLWAETRFLEDWEDVLDTDNLWAETRFLEDWEDVLDTDNLWAETRFMEDVLDTDN